MSQRETGLIKTVFNTDNLVMRISEKIADLVTVNLLFVLSCLPIVTIGIAKISLYQTVFCHQTPASPTSHSDLYQRLSRKLEVGASARRDRVAHFRDLSL